MSGRANFQKPEDEKEPAWKHPVAEDTRKQERLVT